MLTGKELALELTANVPLALDHFYDLVLITNSGRGRVRIRAVVNCKVFSAIII